VPFYPLFLIDTIGYRSNAILERMRGSIKVHRFEVRNSRKQYGKQEQFAKRNRKLIKEREWRKHHL